MYGHIYAGDEEEEEEATQDLLEPKEPQSPERYRSHWGSLLSSHSPVYICIYAIDVYYFSLRNTVHI